MIQAAEPPPADSIRAVLRDVLAAPEYQWDEPRNPLAFLLELLGRIVSWLDGVQDAHPVVYWTIVGFLTGLLVAILGHFVLIVVRALRPRVASLGKAMPRPHWSRDEAWHLEQWRRQRSAGRYTEALAHRFAALILRLDGQKKVKFHPAKTPQEYTGEARLDDVGRVVLNELVASLYRHLFGRAPCTPEDLDHFDHQANRLGERVAA